MNQNNPNPYDQQNYDHYDYAPRRNFRIGLTEKIFGPKISGKLRSPMVATGALLAAGIVFASIIILSYPDKSETNEIIPVIKAEAGPFTETPSERGGMEVPHSDSTVFTIMRDGKVVQDGRVVENLLAPENTEAPINTSEAFPATTEDTAAAEAASAEIATITENVATEPAAGETNEDTPAPTTVTAGETEDSPADTIASAPSQDALKETTTKTATVTRETIPASELIAQAESKTTTTITTDKPATLHAAGSSPETIAFVRSVLDEKDAKKAGATAASAAAVEPASGASTAGTAITPGKYYVQVGSVKAEEGAAGEWGKIQKTHAELSGLEYRVERANLDKGTFFRIQAGPMSKDSASSLCNSIKATKPGGCLVVQ
jgi:hypothetical protein